MIPHAHTKQQHARTHTFSHLSPWFLWGACGPQVDSQVCRTSSPAKNCTHTFSSCYSLLACALWKGDKAVIVYLDAQLCTFPLVFAEVIGVDFCRKSLLSSMIYIACSLFHYKCHHSNLLVNFIGKDSIAQVYILLTNVFFTCSVLVWPKMEPIYVHILQRTWK